MQTGHTTGKQIILTGNQPLLLNQAGMAWLVDSGSVAVFAVEFDRESIRGTRRYLFDVGPGEILFNAVPPVSGRRTLAAVPVENAVIISVDVHLAAAADSGAGFETWVAKLGTVLRSVAPPTPSSATITTGQTFTLEPGQAAQCEGTSTVFVRLVRGSARVMGYEEGRLEPSADLIPLPAGTWLQADESLELETAASTSITGQQLLQRIGFLDRVVYRALEDVERLAGIQAVARFEQRKQLNKRLAAQSLRTLASVTADDRQSTAGVSGQPLFAAAHAVGAAQGITMRAAIGEQEVKRDPVQAIAEASAVRIRSVLLLGRWWEEDNGAFLAYRSAGRAPLALLPVRQSVLSQIRNRSRYEIFDPSAASHTPVTAAEAADLHPKAITFYRPLGGSKAISALIGFGIAFHHADVFRVVVYAAAVAVLGIVIPQSTAILFGQAIPEADRGMVLQVALAMVAALVGAMLFDLSRAVASVRLQTGVTMSLQAAAWDWVLRLKPAVFRDFSVGDLRAHVEGFSRSYDQLSPDVQRVLITGVMSSLYVLLMLYYSVRLGLLALVATLVVLGATALAGLLLARQQEPLQRLEGSLSGLMVQLINAVPKLRVAAAEQRAFAYWGTLYSRKQRMVEEAQRIRDRLRLVNVTVPLVATALVFSLGANGPDVATFLAFTVAFGFVMKSATEVSDTFAGLVSLGARWRRTQKILMMPPEVDAEKAYPGRLSGRLALEHVTFRYRKHGSLTLEDVSIHAELGECIALVGPSGSGKSTILNLVLGFDTPASGAVYLDGQDLAGLDLISVRRQIGVVRQDSKMMSDSILENIICGARCTLNDAWDAARAAGLAEDIEQMPMGMHTVIAEGASNISGGQRQRLLIARALILKPRILLFDEATSALDNRTQRIVTESLNRLKVTRVIVAHRLSTIRHADRIYVIEAGRVVQQGTFDELAGQPGAFAQLMKRQTA